MGNQHCGGKGADSPSHSRFAKRRVQDHPPTSVRDVQGLNEIPAITDDTVIEYITDVEGNWEYFINFVSRSKILYWTGDPRGVWGPGDLAIRPKCILVFGGDAPDKGPGDIRFIKTLTKLKLQHPAQVFIILGNRDLMKMRFLAELAPGDENLDDAWLPTWDKQPKLFSDFLAEKKLKKNRISKLKWMLECNMGCQDYTFSTRKDELAHLNGTATDEHVLHSYTDSVDPRSSDPWMLEFLRAGLIALVLKDTLFVHGGLQDESAGHVPRNDSEFMNVQTWVHALNAWKHGELLEFERNPFWRVGKDGRKTRGGADLIEYGTPGGGRKTVIYYNPFDNGNPVQRTEKVRKFLDESGIKCMISGHQPHGQTPTVVRHVESGLLVITGDTSRSDSRGSKVFNPLNNRGLAISVLRLHGEHVIIEGETNEGRSHGCKLNRRDMSKDALPDALVGRQLVNHAWVKTVISEQDEPKVIVALGRGFNVTVEAMSIQRACMNLKYEYRRGGNFLVKLQEIEASQLLEAWKTIEDCSENETNGLPDARKRTFCFEEQALKAFDSAETYVFSFNGVLMKPDTEMGAAIIRNVNRIIDRRKRVVFITNDSTMSRSFFFNRINNEYRIQALRQMHSSRSLEAVALSEGFSTSEKETSQRLCVITSAYMCAWYCKQHGNIRKPFVIAHGMGLLEELKLAGITNYLATVDEQGTPKKEFSEPVSAANIQNIVKQAPDVDAIIVGWDHRLSALTIAVAENYIRWNEELFLETDGKAGRKLPIIKCSSDLGGIVGRTTKDYSVKHFQDRKVRTIGNGMMANAICNRAGMERIPIDVGKPSQMFMEQLSRGPKDGGLGVNFSTAIMIGDNLRTDVKMANQTGMRSLLVLSGVTSREMVEKEARPEYSPTWIVDSFADVFAPPSS